MVSVESFFRKKNGMEFNIPAVDMGFQVKAQTTTKDWDKSYCMS